MNLEGARNCSVNSAQKHFVLPPLRETKIVDDLPSRVSKSQPKPPSKRDVQQRLPRRFSKVEVPYRAASTAVLAPRSDQEPAGVLASTNAAIVSRKMVERRVSKNSHDWKIGEHIDDETIEKFTLPENIADGHDTLFLDQNGNFICSIAYEAVDVRDDAIDKLAPLARSTRERGAAAGFIDQEKLNALYKNLNEKSGTNQTIVYSAERPWLGYLNGDHKKKRGNQHYSTTFGCARNTRTPDSVYKANDKSASFEKLRPYFKLISDCFESKWEDQYRSYQKIMKEKDGDNFYVADSVFSSMVVNTHQISRDGEIEKDARAAIHTDSGHHDDSFEVMLCLKKNIKGGDLYLPEYGILLKLRNRCVVCFRAKLHKHAVTAITRENLNSLALRVTLVAYMWKFGNGDLKKLVQKSTTDQEQLTNPHTKGTLVPLPVAITRMLGDEEGGEEESVPYIPSPAAVSSVFDGETMTSNAGGLSVELKRKCEFDDQGSVLKKPRTMH